MAAADTRQKTFFVAFLVVTLGVSALVLAALVRASVGPVLPTSPGWALTLVAALLVVGAAALCSAARDAFTRDRRPPAAWLLPAALPLGAGLVAALVSVHDLDAATTGMVPFEATRWGLAALGGPAAVAAWGAACTAVLAALTLLLGAARAHASPSARERSLLGPTIVVFCALAGLALGWDGRGLETLVPAVATAILGGGVGWLAASRPRDPRDGAFLMAGLAASLVAAAAAWLLSERLAVCSFFWVFDAHPEQSPFVLARAVELRDAASRRGGVGMICVAVSATAALVSGRRGLAAAVAARRSWVVAAGAFIALVAVLGAAARLQEQRYLEALAERTRPGFLDVDGLELPTTRESRWAYAGLPTVIVGSSRIAVDGRDVAETAGLAASDQGRARLAEAVAAALRTWDEADRQTYRLLTGDHDPPWRGARLDESTGRRVFPVALAADHRTPFEVLAPVLEALRAEGVDPVEIVTLSEEPSALGEESPRPSGTFGALHDALGGAYGTLRACLPPPDGARAGAPERGPLRAHVAILVAGDGVRVEPPRRDRSEACGPTALSLEELPRCMEDLREQGGPEVARLAATDEVDLERLVRTLEVLESVRHEPTFERIEIWSVGGASRP